VNRNPLGYHLDLKLKPESIPEWNGDEDTVVRWILKINDLARESTIMSEQLGHAVPRRLRGDAEEWYFSLPVDHRTRYEQNWDTLKDAITSYWMNRKWLDRMKAKANRAHFREIGHSKETPSRYFIRKTELLMTVYELSDSELIMEVMDGAPANWNTVLNTQNYANVVEFQSAIRYHEDTLLRLGVTPFNNTW
jgi:hypothetical protein